VKMGQSWDGPISPTIRGRVKKTNYIRMSKGGTGGMSELSTTLLTGRGSTRTRFEGSHSSPWKRSALVMLLKSRGTEKGPTGPH
jgi:hypothetical protein